jgi:hypothetical protein
MPIFRIGARFVSALVIAGMLLTGLPEAAAQNPAAECSGSKRKAAGKKANAKLKCVAKAAASKQSSPVDPLCMTKAEDKFDRAFTKADDKGGCLATDDAATIEALVDACVGQIRTELGIPGDPPSRSLCSSGELKAAGKKLKAKMNCYAKAAKKFQPVDPTCLSKAETKFTTAFEKAELKADCYTMSDAATVESIVDVCVTDLVEALPLPVATCGPEPGSFAGITAQHNDTRMNATPAPSPALDPMCWSELLASDAQAWADRCDFSHDPDLDNLHEGQNLYAVASSMGFPPDPTLDAEPAWAAEAADYDYSTNTCAPSAQCGHYTQIVWRDSTLVGCGIKECTMNSPGGPGFPNWIIVVCNYSPPGNVPGQRPY